MSDLVELANARMPFGKYKGRYLTDLPEAYYVWFSRKGYPEGKLGQMLAAMYELKTNGLEKLLIHCGASESCSKDLRQSCPTEQLHPSQELLEFRPGSPSKEGLLDDPAAE